jgi:anti-sigma B factor antagonist
MNVATLGTTLTVGGLRELNATNASAFRDSVRNALSPEIRQVDLDFSETQFLDSSGLGALISIHKSLTGRDGQVRVVNPTAPVLQILELTRMHRIFEIVRS